jgi:hypothetical protein
LSRQAACSCGELRLEVDSEPVRVSVCHCLACQRRTGSVFGAQARFVEEDVRIEGRHTDYTRISDDGEARTSSFCPECGATVFFKLDSVPGFIAVPVGAFADPGFPPPRKSMWESRRHAWVVMPDTIDERID